MHPILSNLLFVEEIMAEKKPLKNIGQLWKGKDKEQKPMLSGNIDLGIFGTFNVLVLNNGRKEKATHPDYLVFVKTKEAEEEKNLPAPSSEEL